MDFIDNYNDPIIGRKRSGTLRDPYKDITETLFVTNGKTVLTEIPNRGNRIMAYYNGIPLIEIEDGEIQDNTFKVDYPNGVVFFDEKYNNKTITFSYLGEGAFFFPGSRIWMDLHANGSIDTLNDKLDNIHLMVDNQTKRLDEQIKSIPQPSEIVDIRVDAHGNVYRVAKERLDALQLSFEDARNAKDGSKYGTIKERLDDTDDRLGEVWKFKADGNSLTDKTLNEFLQRGLNVTWFGAKGNNEQLASDFIQLALDYGGHIYIPEGTFLIDKPLYLKSNTSVIMHPKCVLKRVSGDVSAVFLNGRPGEEYFGYDGNGDILIEGGTIDVNGNVVQKTVSGIAIGHGNNITIRDVTIKNPYNSHHIEINSSRNVLVDHCIFEGYYHDGTRAYAEAIQIDMAKNYDVFPFFGSFDKTMCTNITIENCSFHDVGGGIGTHVTDVMLFHDTIYILNNTFETCLDIAIHSVIFRKLIISGNKIYNAKRGIHLQNTYEAMIIDNHIKACNEHGILIANTNTVSIRGNHITNNIKSGISIYEGSYGILMNSCFIYDNYEMGVNIESPENVLMDSIIKRNGTHGVYLHDTTDVKIKNNYVYGNKRNGIVVTNASYNFLEDNYVHSNNQSNDGSSNVVLNISSKGNRLINNKIKVGTSTYKPTYGIYIGADCTSTRVFMNDYAQGGKDLDFKDLTNTAIMDVNNGVQKGVFRTENKVTNKLNNGVLQKLPLGNSVQDLGNMFVFENNYIKVNKQGNYFWKYIFNVSDDFKIDNLDMRFHTYVNGVSNYVSEKVRISTGDNLVIVKDMVTLEVGDKLEIYLIPWWTGSAEFKTKESYFMLWET